MTFKGLLNERMLSNFQISIKEKRELRTATENYQIGTNKRTKLRVTFYQISNDTV